ncbi:ATP synthase subunit I [Burkholderiaceae bacterium FT117]|uniref:N-ATPase subunit AtpR n=1 Tax=Zeimonas sediminis TaxID=2944268 RepID=UPI0023431617|nr:ATP synthase subunit I [Zeimonas sediminis]MCM5571977.1 ATP synthase subunit I [Zeimonas sediminis]
MTDGQGAGVAAWLVGALAGGLLGLAFFAGLRLTVNALASARRPALLMLASLFARTLLAVAVFWAVGRWAGWQGLVAALGGFLVARTALLARARREDAARPADAASRQGGER